MLIVVKWHKDIVQLTIYVAMSQSSLLLHSYTMTIALYMHADLISFVQENLVWCIKVFTIRMV